MTTFHCDKLCSCETCAPIRWALSYIESFGKPLGSYAAVCHRESAAYLAAWWASRDPAKLAELLVLGCQARGWHSFDEPGDYMVLPCVRVVPCIVDGTGYMNMDTWVERATSPILSCHGTSLTMLQARAKLLAIMQTAHDESSREACEQILKGKP